MKKTVKIISAAIALITLVCLLAACGKTLNGTYESEGIIPQSFTFDKDGTVTFSAFGVDAATGTYRIEKDKLIITYSILGFSTDLEQSFKKSGSSLIIGGTEFVKK